MAVPTVDVFCPIVDQNGSPVSGAVIKALLDRPEVYQGYIVPREVEVVADENGEATLSLFPNALGAEGSRYKIRITDPTNGHITKIMATIPAVNSNLWQVANLPSMPRKTEAQLAQDEALGTLQGYIHRVEEGEQAIATSEAAAQTARGGSEVARDQSEMARDLSIAASQQSEASKNLAEQAAAAVTETLSDLQTVSELATTHVADHANPHGVTKAQLELENVTNDAQVTRAEKGQAGGVPTLSESCRVVQPPALHAAQHALSGEDSLAIVVASMPAHYARSALATVASMTDAEGRRTYIPPARISGNVNDSGFYAAGLSGMDLNVAENWDTTAGTDGTIANNRAGKDVYTYLCTQIDGTFKLLYSFNSTYPAGYTSSNSRKCGGFHCLCVAAGVISGHPASGFLAGDIVPPSIWDLQWRPRCAPEGMRYVAGVWQDIYMPSVIGGALRPVYGGTMADGASTPVFDWYDFTEWLAREGKRLATQAEFMAGALGSNEGTNIVGSVDPGTAGGHTDTAGRRMISATFGEDYCGVMWQWGIEPGAVPGSAAWKIQFVAARTTQRGQSYQEASRALLGGGWNDGAYCGSRGSIWSYGPLLLYSSCGARGVAEPLAA